MYFDSNTMCHLHAQQLIIQRLSPCGLFRSDIIAGGNIFINESGEASVYGEQWSIALTCEKRVVSTLAITFYSSHVHVDLYDDSPFQWPQTFISDKVCFHTMR